MHDVPLVGSERTGADDPKNRRRQPACRSVGESVAVRVRRLPSDALRLDPGFRSGNGRRGWPTASATGP